MGHPFSRHVGERIAVRCGSSDMLSHRWRLSGGFLVVPGVAAAVALPFIWSTTLAIRSRWRRLRVVLMSFWMRVLGGVTAAVKRGKARSQKTETGARSGKRKAGAGTADESAR